jgi:hypothetical protein
LFATVAIADIDCPDRFDDPAMAFSVAPASAADLFNAASNWANPEG